MTATLSYSVMLIIRQTMVADRLRPYLREHRAKVGNAAFCDLDKALELLESITTV
jgi:hypothetical protein